MCARSCAGHWGCRNRSAGPSFRKLPNYCPACGPFYRERRSETAGPRWEPGNPEDEGIGFDEGIELGEEGKGAPRRGHSRIKGTEE